jgi:hypothetical protein
MFLAPNCLTKGQNISPKCSNKPEQAWLSPCGEPYKWFIRCSPVGGYFFFKNALSPRFALVGFPATSVTLLKGPAAAREVPL